ncbi:MAG: CDP-alcohol phosphatidyltransferase family protein [Candidatus Nanopelagicales bacterium]
MTIPNIISFTRLVGVLFLIYFGFIDINYVVVLILFAYAGISDWLDGFLARKLQQFSDLGAKLDPLADRLYIVTALFIVLNNELIPIWVVFTLILREVGLGLFYLLLRYRRFDIPPVLYIGKAGTLMLMYAFPILILSDFELEASETFKFIGISFLAWAIVTYWYAGYLYLRQGIQALKGN